MARFHGKVGFLIYGDEYDDQSTGISEPMVVDRTYFGRIVEHTRRWDSTDHLSDDLSVSNQIAIVGNDYAYEHASAIAYVHWMGAYWKVASVRVRRPELILTLGGVWNGPTG